MPDKSEEQLKALHEQAQEALQESEERFKELFENANDIIYTHDLTGNFISINQEAVRVYGYTPEEAKKVNIAQIVDPEYLQLAMQKIQEKMKGSPSTEPYELLTRNKKGEPIWVEVSTRLLMKDGKPFGVQGIARDITKRKAREQANKEFVSLASHQLRTPLTTIKLIADALTQKDLGLSEDKEKEYLEKIFDSTEDMLKLVEDLLDVSRLETGRLKPDPEQVQLEDLVQRVVKEIEVVAKEGNCQVIFNKPENKLPKILVDPELIQQVVHNLLTNAVRYSPESGGKVEVGLELKNGRTEERKNQGVEKGGEREASGSSVHAFLGSYVLLSVKDNGIGIPEEDRHRVFDKFFRTDNAKRMETGGTGLGLYLAKMIVEESGGEIWFESAGRGKGTTFFVALSLKNSNNK